MWVYGDRSRRADPRELLAAIGNAVRRGAPSLQAGADRMATSTLIEAGEVAQGLIDAEFMVAGEDDFTPLHATAVALVLAIARQDHSGAKRALDTLAGMTLPRVVTCNEPEGYAHYALYPQAYAAAARARRWSSSPLVIGLRSIGASLAPAVAAAAGSARVVTLRPVGAHFRREIRASAALCALLLGHHGPFIIVDEGPGLSGSSFAAAARLLERLGVARHRVVFMPSHPGDPGVRADPDDLALWRGSDRLVVTADEMFAPDAVSALFADLIGTPHRIEDLSGGRWRDEWPIDQRPPAWPGQERRKLRLSTPAGVFIARFAGLGRIGAEKMSRAAALFDAGFTPEPIALRRGVLLERWVGGQMLESVRDDRTTLVDHLGAYIAFRARAFPAPADRGAGLETLVEMALVNAGELGGDHMKARISGHLAALDLDEAGLRPIHIDGRLHPWEWVRGGGGRLIKTDAIDHAVAHDLIGPQDAAWDLAGAIAEFELSAVEQQRLLDTFHMHGGPVVSVERLSAFRIFYLAFQGGWWAMAAESGDSPTSGEAKARSEVYAAQLTSLS